MSQSFICEVGNISQSGFGLTALARIRTHGFINRQHGQPREVLNSNVIIPCSSLALHQLGLTLSCKTKKFQQCSTMNDRRFNCSICEACGFAFDNFFPIEKHSKGWWIIPSHGVPECKVANRNSCKPVFKQCEELGRRRRHVLPKFQRERQSHDRCQPARLCAAFSKASAQAHHHSITAQLTVRIMHRRLRPGLLDVHLRCVHVLLLPATSPKIAAMRSENFT